MVPGPDTGSSESTKVYDDSVHDFPLTSGFREYPKYRDDFLRNCDVWLRGKKEVDNVHPYWRIHDKLYDLSQFKNRHPGGSFWLDMTCGTDITELFESSHFGPLPGNTLKKYFVKDIETPRNSPFTFHEDGFYRTLKRKVEPIIAKVGKGPSRDMLFIQDSLLFSFILTFYAAGWYSSTTLAIISGIFLSLSANAAHNFFHQKDNWRMYIFDLMILSSKDWRISHAISHHPFPNTVYDYELNVFDPLIKFLPMKSKSFLDRYGVLVTSYFIFAIAFFIDIFKKFILICKKKAKFHLENLFPIIELFLMMYINGSIQSGFWYWLVVHLTANVFFLVIGFAAAHHHPEIYHEYDALMKEKDWGLFQLVAIRDKGDILPSLFLVAISFGNHTLHHLFPTVDHSKLPHLMPPLLETCKEFGVKFELSSSWRNFKGLFMQLAKILPNPNTPKCIK